MENWLPIIGPILGATGILGLITTYFTIRGNAPRTLAEAKKLEAEAKKINTDTVIDERVFYENYAERLEGRMKKMETRIRDLEALIEEKDKAHALVVIQKDKRIDDLEARVVELEGELKKYQGMEHKVEEVKVNLHDDVDKNIDKLTKV